VNGILLVTIIESLKRVRNFLLMQESLLRIKGVNGLILDVGSGACPLPFAHVLADLNIKDNSQRQDSKLKIDGKPFVQCDAHFLPFREKVFDYVQCAHILEHLDNPKRALEEFKRVGERIHIIAPSWIREDIFCSDPYHKWIFVQKKKRIFARRPRKGKNLRLYRHPLFFFFTKFEYLANKVLPIFVHEMDIDLKQEVALS
jgi:SAM-dependent methyltransferase